MICTPPFSVFAAANERDMYRSYGHIPSPTVSAFHFKTVQLPQYSLCCTTGQLILHHLNGVAQRTGSLSYEAPKLSCAYDLLNVGHLDYEMK